MDGIGQSRRQLLNTLGMGFFSTAVISSTSSAQSDRVNTQSRIYDATDDGLTFSEDFETGQIPDWEKVWRDANTLPSNDWSVVQENSSEGDHSLYLDASGDSNRIATSDRVIDLSGDFELSFNFKLGDESHRSCALYLYDSEDNGSEEDPLDDVRENSDTLLMARYHDTSNETSFRSLGNEEQYEDRYLITPDEFHDMKLIRDGDHISIYVNGEIVLEGNVNESEYNFENEYRLMIGGSGVWGRATEIWFDDIQFERKDAVTEDPESEEEEKTEKPDEDEKTEETDPEEDQESDESESGDDHGELVASIDYTPSEPSVSERIAFDANSSTSIDAEIISYEWDFDDGETASGPQTSHEYGESGGYNISLSVVDSDGESESVTEQIHVAETNASSDDDSIPGFGIGATIVSIGGLGYVLKERINSQPTTDS